jgi:HK97 family phage prohead protease
MPQTEKRFLTATELRAGGGSGKNDSPLFIEGYAAVFNKPSLDLGGFKERIKPGTFSRALREKQDVRCLWNHNADVVLGRSIAGTLTLKEDERGLFYRCDLPDTQQARDLHTSIKRGDVNSCSFSFNVARGGESWDECDPDDLDCDDKDSRARRTLTDVDLHDVSPVCFAAYPATSLAARSGRGQYEKRFSEATMQNFSQEQRAYLRTECEGRFAVVPINTPEPFLSQILEKRAAVLGVSPAGVAPAPNSDLADELNALRAL